MFVVIQLHKVEYKRANRVRISCNIVRLFGSWFFCTVKKNLFNQSAARVTFLYPLYFSLLMRNE